LELGNEPSWDWSILLAAKTGMRFAEVLGLTPSDFDFSQQKVRITKTWGYKNGEAEFAKTKNESSKRTISIDPRLAQQMQALVASLPADKPIFVGTKRIFNSTVNGRLVALCKRAGVPEISFHCLRHTHASLLIFAGVSIASIAMRLGHSNITTTQETYLHIIQELEDKDNDKVLTHLGELDR
jgi:integrase